MEIFLIIALVFSLIGIAYFWSQVAAHKVKLQERNQRLAETSSERDGLAVELASVRAEREAALGDLAEAKADQAAHAARIEEITKVNKELETKFKGIADDVTKANSEAFLKHAREQFENQKKLSEASLRQREQAIDELVKPVKDNLAKFEQQVGKIEKEREGAYASLKEQVGHLHSTTKSLSEALRSSTLRGKWGEQQLRNILELSGLSKHIDYNEQVTVDTDQGKGRPDAVVRIPNGAKVVIDAKTPMDSYLQAHEAADEESKKRSLNAHAATLFDHAKTLGNRKYSAVVAGSPEFVVMFVPADPILDEAMDVRPMLWEDAWRTHGVLIATPGLLLAFLKTVALAWQRQDIQENAEKIAQAGADLYDSLRVYADHVDGVGKGLGRAVDAYNRSVGSLRSRVIPRAQKFEALGVDSGAKQIDEPAAIEQRPRDEGTPEQLGL
ncbi:MAG: DNA recombination protein RmuC [Acidimicrobiia bacterium]|nr:DNA recombination protein RmuC [Acidimicrobiia bacterium]